MKKNKAEKRELKRAPEVKRHPEARGLLYLSLSILLFISLLSFVQTEPKANWLGLLGHYLAWGMHYSFGLGSYIIGLFFTSIGWRLLSSRSQEKWDLHFGSFCLFLLSTCLLFNVAADHLSSLPQSLQEKIYSSARLVREPYPHLQHRFHLGGAPLYYLYRDLPNLSLRQVLSDVGILLTFSALGIVSFLLMTGIQILPFLQKFSFSNLWEKGKRLLFGQVEHPLTKQSPDQIEKSLMQRYEMKVEKKEEVPKLEIRTLDAPREEKKNLAPKPNLTKRDAALRAQKVHNGDYTDYEIPPPSLLTAAKPVDQPQLKKELLHLAKNLEETLSSFGIEAKVGSINCGPTIMSFEVHPAVGVKVQKITALESDIALNLQARSIRIIAPIPGKAAVGVEIPSLYPQEVSFRELLEHYQRTPRKPFIPVLLGKTVAGDNLISDLTKMPHCIIAGATGSGKSVCINTIVMSILMTARPDEIKLLMIDPKKVELSAYSPLPHMIAPVITEPHGAYAALNWLVKEMQIRYEILKQLGVRNIAAFNARKINPELEGSLNIQVPEKMFAIVAIIDEFADLMMVSGADLETPIARIAQMARAVGIHLVLATQRPSREVITGLIKANFPTRIAFKVASRVNSQIILDENGAETLLGNGDMLFIPPGSSFLTRAQGAFIRDEDINKTIAFICDQAPTNYLIKSFDTMQKQEMIDFGGAEEEKKDTLIDETIRLILDNKTASTTFVQRKLKIGYARAASLIDELEEKGVLGPADGSRPRKIFYDKAANLLTGTPPLTGDIFEE